ncbi:uncharacterized protein NEMAJ01_1239 [Nematocida major]|uniref:uncharacterized protein n=1 Tax=Nematocida major TaxID=1912982 RepID=UPI002007B3D8|nr:uncharacterized protein NEMAJ01_1239 [Nematocida major]KAH9386343.1 hypothetical protein NEMAJ01_1239 [Nematocida major]
MNENTLNLHESMLELYVNGLISGFHQRKKELVILVTNMPEKHSMVNHICEELLAKYTQQEILELELEMLNYASKDYFLLTNALLYLERRWSTETIRHILKAAISDEEHYSMVISLVTDPREEDAPGPCAVEANITVPANCTALAHIHGILHNMHKKSIVSSMRDAFTAYKVIVSCGANVPFILSKLDMLESLESVLLSDILGGALVVMLYEPREIPHMANVLHRLLKRNRLQLQSFIQLLITAYNLKDEMWETLQNFVPHFYMRLGIERNFAACLLHTLNLKNTIVLYELLNGEVPALEMFDRCVQARHAMYDNELRQCLRELLAISDEETYTVLPAPPTEAPLSFAERPPTKHSEVADMLYFCHFYAKKSSPSITHMNNTTVEYRDVIGHMSEQERTLLVQTVLSYTNSLVHKELTVNKIYTICSLTARK